VNFLLDTNVVSEPTRPRPNQGLLVWLASVNEESVFISTVTISELRYGVERLSAGRRRTRLDSWLRNDLLHRFEGRVLPVDIEVADACGRLSARSESQGRSIEACDAIIAATAEVHGLTLVTRDAPDFKAVLKYILTPWT
jgi:predicted nucleic acid-binding protein